MTTKFSTPPTVQHVQNEGTAFQTTGMVLAAIGLIGGLVILFASGSPVLLGLIPIGLLVAITGYLKQIAAATIASYVLASNNHSAGGQASEQ